MTDQPAVELALSWRPAPVAVRLVSVAAFALVLALALGQTRLVLVAAPLVGALAAGWLRALPRRVAVRCRPAASRCFEGEGFDVKAVVGFGAPIDRIAARLDVPAGLVVTDVERTHGTRFLRVRWTLRADRWGRQPLRLHLDLAAGAGMVRASCTLPAGPVSVYPYAPALTTLLAPSRLAARLGEHVSRAAGQGAEFSGIRQYRPGEPHRRINWAVSSRRDRLYANEFGAERAVDLVVAIDVLSDVGPPGRSSLDLAVRGAAATVRGYLRRADRAGVVMLGGIPLWLAPDVGQRQFYRIVDYLLRAPGITSVLDPDLDRIPRTALPRGALVVLFTPLLDPRIVEAAGDLRERGHPLVVVDVLTVEPPVGRSAAELLALRLWRLDRLAVRHKLAGHGVHVLDWDGGAPLDAVFARLRRRPLVGAPR